MLPATLDLSLVQGTTWDCTAYWMDPNLDPVNLTAYKAKLQVRTVAADPQQLMELSTDIGRIVLWGSTGKITINATVEDTSGLEPGVWAYDLQLTAGDGRVYVILKGNFTVIAAVTR